MVFFALKGQKIKARGIAPGKSPHTPHALKGRENIAQASLVTNPSPSFPRMRESIAEFPGFLHSQE
jgi:hypothetical protein